MQLSRVRVCVRRVATRDGLLRTPSITSSTFTASHNEQVGEEPSVSGARPAVSSERVGSSSQPSAVRA